MSNRMFAAAMLAAIAGSTAFGTGSAEARQYPGCGYSKNQAVCGMWTRNTKVKVIPRAQHAPAGQAITTGGAQSAPPCKTFINGCYTPPIRPKK